MILVFCRAYNDVDQITPVVWKLASEGRKDIKLILLDPEYDVSKDFRIRFLQESFGIPLSYYHYKPGMARWYTRALLHIIHGPFSRAILKAAVGIAGFFGGKVRAAVKKKARKIHKKIALYLPDRNYSKRFLEYFSPSVIISDDCPGKYLEFELFNTAIDMGIPVIGFPHGMKASVDLYITERVLVEAKKGQERSFPHEIFSALVTQFEGGVSPHITNQTPPEKIHILGSARYCSEWREVYKNIVPSPVIRDRDPNQKKLRVVFMDHESVYGMERKIITNNIKAVLDLDFIDFVLKPSTGRKNFKLPSINYFATPELFNMCRLATEEESYNLIKWADVVIVTVSSIFLEVLLQGKTLIYPGHFSSLTTRFEQYEACWKVESEEELINALQRAWEEPGYRPYSQDSVDRLYTAMVYNGNPELDVLSAQQDLILSAERGEFATDPAP